MITLKFCKKDELAFVSHIDLLRLIVRTVRRSGLDVKFSEGFNPHMMLNFSSPLPVGMNSSAEFVTIHTDCKATKFLEAYNKVAVKGLEGISAYDVNKNPNLAAKVVAADYSIRHKGACAFKQEIEDILNKSEYYIEYPTKKNPKGQRDAIPSLFGLKVYNDTICVCLSAGNETLRADRFFEHIARIFDIELDMASIWRYNQYVRAKLLTNVEDFLANKHT